MISASPDASATPSRRWTALLIVAGTLFLCALTWGPAPAHAALGDITFEDCVAETGNAGCVDPPKDALNGAFGVAASPNGESVYLTTITDDSITHFTRNGAGHLTFENCVANGALEGCDAPTQDSLEGARGVAVSPGGDSVYVASSDDDSVTHFTANASGQLTFESCIADGGASGCTSAGSLDGAFDVEVSPDGDSVYVASQGDDSVTHFTRNGSGQLTFEGCVADGGGSGCADPASDSLDGALDVAASPEGDSVYVSSQVDDSVTGFTADGGGALTFQGCVADGGGSGCDDPSIDSLDGTRGLDVSPDGESVYVAASADSAVTTLSRASGGEISFHSCIAESGGSGCADPATDSLNGALGVTVTPDGESVYVASAGTDNSITHLSRGAGGALSFAGCVAEAGASGCVDPPKDALNQARGVAVSSNGKSVYLASGLDNSISHFTRATPQLGNAEFDSCIADGGLNGCADPPLDPLGGARASAVSPDGRSVYVASFIDDSITHFSRAPDGKLTLEGCIANGGGSGCVDPPNDSLDTLTDVAVSPDGSSVYVTASAGNSVTHFTTGPDGELTFDSCIANNGVAGCADPALDSIGGAQSVAVSPDGQSVYVTSTSINAVGVTHLVRAPNGDITFGSCVTADGDAGCVNPPGATDPLDLPMSVAVSPDGASVYVAAGNDNAIVHLTRAPNGVLTFESCIRENGGLGCANPPTDSLFHPEGVTVSPDGKSVYATAQLDNAVTHLIRGPTGALSFGSCVANAAGSGCADPPNDSLGEATGVAVSPRGDAVYVASTVGDSLTQLARAGDGTLTQQSCVANAGTAGCADPPNDSLNNARDVSLSPSGGSVYVAASAGITHFRTAPQAPTIASTDPDPPANDNDPEVQGAVGSGSSTTVRLYRDPECAGAPDAQGSVAEFTGAGITLNVGDDITTAIRARALDADGSISECSAPFAYEEDSTAPETTIDEDPGSPTDATPTFEFSADEGGATFECRVDADPFDDCSSPHTTAALDAGEHTFEVRALDAVGNADPSPASHTFDVDATAPDAPSITGSDPASPARDATPLIEGDAEDGSTVRLYDSADCTGSPIGEGTAAELAAGISVDVTDDATTTIKATATDGVGNASDCSAGFDYTDLADAGDIAFASCVAENGNAGCTDPPTDSLDGAYDLATSPDGGSVYVVARADDSITHLTRDSNGDLAFAGCVANNGASGCADPAIDSLDEPNNVAVSPEGDSVYVGSRLDNSVTHFSADGSGALTFEGCFADNGQSGCADPPNDSLGGATGVAVSPDGESVYVGTFTDDAVTAFDRAGDGSLSFDSCVANNGGAGCVDPSIDSLELAWNLTVSPDGESVYVAAESGQSITHLTRGAGGGLTFESCIAENGANGCDDPPIDSLQSPHGIAVSPDGSAVYTTSQLDSAVTRFDRDAGGALAFDSCVANHGANGCDDPPIDSIDGPFNVAVSPDGESAYVGTFGGDSITHFTLGASAGIAFSSCVGYQGANGCADPPIDSLSLPAGVAVSPDGKSVYAAAVDTSSVTHLSRTLAADPPTITDTDPDSPSNDDAPEVKGTVTGGPATHVRLYADDPACAGTPDAEGTVDEFTGAGITLDVAADATSAIRARAVDANGDASICSDAFEYVEDSTAPQTTIEGNPPAVTADTTPTFDFSADEDGSTFECRVDSEAFDDCSGPGATHTTAVLGDGSHTFEVRAVDPVDNTDPTPASHDFTVDTIAPGAPAITDTDPNSPANDTTPQVKGSAEAGSTVRLYSSADCTGAVRAQGSASSFASPGLTVTVPNGSTTIFRATATDAAGNVSGCSAGRTYVETNPQTGPPPAADTDPPETEIVSGPKKKTTKKKATFELAADEQGATFECSLDGKGFAPCSSPHKVKAKKKGKHVLQVQATDAARNADPTPAEHRWKLKLKKKR